MKAKLSIDDLCAKHGNDEAHSRHVTALALALFDALGAELGMAPSDRRLLEAACRLHDIGFRKDPGGHPRTGAQIVMREGLRGFSDAGRRLVAAAILLHPRDYHPALRHPYVARLRDPGRALRLGAFLRVADALDHSHLQDATIKAVDLTGRTVRVLVASGWYAGNAAWADTKADLWRERLPLGIQFTAAGPERARPLFRGVVREEDTVLGAARRILYSQCRVMADCRSGALASDDPACVHDLRVAIRRFRMALRFFRPHLPAAPARRLNERVSRLADRLGPIRDAQVWMEFLDAPARERFAADPAWRAYRARQDAVQRRLLRLLRQILSSAECSALMRAIIRFLRIQVPDRERRAPPLPFAPHAARRVRRLYARILDERHLTPETPGEEFHRLRRLVRRARYWAEFAAPALGGHVQRLALRLKAVADALGDIHDMDVHLRRLARQTSAPVLRARLKGNVAELRQSFWHDYDRAWQNLREKRFRTRMLARLARQRRQG